MAERQSAAQLSGPRTGVTLRRPFAQTKPKRVSWASEVSTASLRGGINHSNVHFALVDQDGFTALLLRSAAPNSCGFSLSI